jgi:hypothetical protein
MRAFRQSPGLAFIASEQDVNEKSICGAVLLKFYIETP